MQESHDVRPASWLTNQVRAVPSNEKCRLLRHWSAVQPLWRATCSCTTRSNLRRPRRHPHRTGQEYGARRASIRVVTRTLQFAATVMSCQLYASSVSSCDPRSVARTPVRGPGRLADPGLVSGWPFGPVRGYSA